MLGHEMGSVIGAALRDLAVERGPEPGPLLYVEDFEKDLQVRACAQICLIPDFDGAIRSKEWKEALWDKFVMAAPRPRTPSEQQYSDRKLRSRN